MSQLRSLLEDFRLTTAEIIYHLPDRPVLLQSFIWQDYDLPPNFPKLLHFLEFWSRTLDGRLHSVTIVHTDHLAGSKINLTDFLGTIR